MAITLTCPVCGSTFTRFPSNLTGQRGPSFCSHACRNRVVSRGSGNGNWKGGSYIQAGYRYVLRAPGEYVQEHRLVAEQMLGRPLLDDERVHHLNHDRLDNRPENLRVMTQSEHRSYHPVTRGFPVTDWVSRGGACLDCGETVRPHYARGVCRRCYGRRRSKH